MCYHLAVTVDPFSPPVCVVEKNVCIEIIFGANGSKHALNNIPRQNVRIEIKKVIYPEKKSKDLFSCS